MRCLRLPDASRPDSYALALQRRRGDPGAGLEGRSERVARCPESVSASPRGRLLGAGSVGAELELVEEG